MILYIMFCCVEMLCIVIVYSVMLDEKDRNVRWKHDINIMK